MKPSTRRVLEALERAGRRGCSTHDLMQPNVGGERFSARVAELRADGYTISSKYERQGSYRYRLLAHPRVEITERPDLPPTDEPWSVGPFCWACVFGIEHDEHIFGQLVIGAEEQPAALPVAA
jgi:hypothetical protein